MYKLPVTESHWRYRRRPRAIFIKLLSTLSRLYTVIDRWIYARETFNFHLCRWQAQLWLFIEDL